jgi:hypothetical protein
MNAAEHWEAAERLVDMVTDSETGLIVSLDADGVRGLFTAQMLTAAQVHATLACAPEPCGDLVDGKQ